MTKSLLTCSFFVHHSLNRGKSSRVSARTLTKTSLAHIFPLRCGGVQITKPMGNHKKSVKSYDFTDFLCEIDSALNIFLPMIFTTFRCTWMARFLKSMSDHFRAHGFRIRRYDQLLPAALRGAIGFLLVM